MYNMYAVHIRHYFAFGNFSVLFCEYHPYFDLCESFGLLGCLG